MKEDCATGMAASQGCNDGKDVVERFKEALKQRIGEDRFRVWFDQVTFRFVKSESVIAPYDLLVTVAAQFALDRIAKNYLPQLRGAASQACGQTTAVRLELGKPRQVGLPLGDDGAPIDGIGETSHLVSRAAAPEKPTSRPARPNRKTSSGKSRGAKSIQSILRDGASNRRRDPGASNGEAKRQTHRDSQKEIDSASSADRPASSGPIQQTIFGDGVDPKTNQVSKPENAKALSVKPGGDSTQPPSQKPSWSSFIAGPGNQLAHTACRMVCETPSLAAPLFLWGPPGCGKTHLLRALESQLKRMHGFRRVVMLTAEAFTNDFIRSVSGSGLPGFRGRYRDVDVLLIDDVQFLGDKNATLRELLYTVETLGEAGRAMIFASTMAPGEIPGFGVELAGRMAGGLVCHVQPLDMETRKTLLKTYVDQFCPIAWPDTLLSEIANLAAGDGRVILGIVRLVALLQQMSGEMPTMNQIRESGGHLLRNSDQPVTLSAIERAVERVFEMPSHSMQSTTRTKTVSEPRMLAMYLSREWTSCAFGEIGRHYGGRSHSTAILASQRVRNWLENGRSIGRGPSGISVSEALRRVESLLRSG